MTPFDYANQIAELDPQKESYRQEVERVIRKAFADELCRVAGVIDQADRTNVIRFPTEAAQICRDEAALHKYHT